MTNHQAPTRQQSYRHADCDVCGQRLAYRSRKATQLCIDCVRAGAAFAREWMADLERSGVRHAVIADVVGVASADAVRARLSDRRKARHAG